MARAPRSSSGSARTCARATPGARSRCGTSRGSAAASTATTRRSAPFWNVLYDAGADLILNGHDHDYERFAPQDPNGNRDKDHGIVEIVVGTGGGEMRGIGPPVANSIVGQGRLLGVIQVTLHPDGWSWRFLSTDGSFTDSGDDRCH